jgi:hypothetical protein
LANNSVEGLKARYGDRWRWLATGFVAAIPVWKMRS